MGGSNLTQPQLKLFNLHVFYLNIMHKGYQVRLCV